MTNGRPTSRRTLLKLGGATAAGVAAAAAAPQLVAARPALPADSPGVFSADGSLGHINAVKATGSKGAIGVFGTSDTSTAVFGASGSLLDILAGGTGRIQQFATIVHAGPPVKGDGLFFAGEQIRDINYALWLCVAGDGTTVGTWRQVAALAPGYTGGSLNLLAVPIRLLDTRAGATVGNLRPNAPVAYHGTIDVPAAGVTYQK